MGQLIVRDVDDEIIRRLKERAAENGRSMEAAHRLLLEDALGGTGQGFWEMAARLRARTTATRRSDSADLIRADRDRDHAAEEP